VLRAAAALLRPACRDGDVLARWGEDEFAMFLPGAAAADAQALAARLRETAATIRWAAAPDAAPDGIDLTAAVAAHPDRGDQLEGLLDAAVRTFGARSDAPTSSAEAPATQTVDAPAAQPAAAVTAPRESVPPPRR
jgi:diguanylate cyclase (GGDEF)-like protein